MIPFTVVVPYYNRERWLPRALSSLYAVDYRPLQLILVDNGSTDTSADVCRAFRAEVEAPDFTVRLLTESRPGASAARNAGLAAATSPYVTFFDSDDEMSPSFLTDMARLLAEADMAAGATRMVYPDGRETVRRVYRNASAVDQVLTGMLATQGMAFRTDFVRRIGGWDETVLKWNDWELGLRALLYHPRVAWSEAVYHRVYQHDDSLTGTSFSATLPGIRTALSAADALCRRLAPADGRLRAALRARRAFLAGRLRREGDEAASRSILLDIAPGFALRLLYHYVARGGRGAWWIARKCLGVL